jgi:hypothetical protein
MRAERRPRPGRPERPLDPGDGPLARFARELRELRAAGSPSYRELSRRALFSASVLSAAAGGYSLPSLQVTLAYAGACGGDLGDWRRRWESAAADLGALGVRAPADPQRRTGLYRSVLAARRILVLLDNASCESAVRPLLVAGERSLFVTTSRNRLAGLEGARRVTLDVLPPADAQRLLTAVAGPVLAADPGVADTLGELCGHLPLALWIAATRLAGHGRPDDVAARLLRGARPRAATPAVRGT